LASGAFFRGEGIVVHAKFFLGTCLTTRSSIVFGFWLNLVNFIENSRKSEKCKNNFVGFPVNSPTTFVKHDHSFA
jgi:hypothetical protein